MGPRFDATAWARAYGIELFLLPLVAGCATTSWAVVVSNALLPEVSSLYVVGIGLLSALAVYSAILIAALNIPVSMHLSGMLLALLLSVVESGGFVKLLITFTTWIAAMMLGSVCAAALPTEEAGSRSFSIAKRLDEVRLERKVHAHSRMVWMARAARGRSVILISSATGAWLLAETFKVETPAGGRTAYLTAAGTVLIFSLVLFTALLHLLSRKRLWSEDQDLYVASNLSSMWPVMIALVLLSVLVLAVVLPIDLSPLYSVDWNTIMDDLTVRLFASVRPDPGGVQQGGRPVTAGSTAVGTFRDSSGFELLPLLYALVAVGILVWVSVKLVGHLSRLEAERGRGVFRILRALAGFPVRLLSGWWHALMARLLIGTRKQSLRPAECSRIAEEDVSPIGTAHQALANTTVRHLFVLLLLWAGEQGSHRRKEQTAKEFANTLQRRFPTVASEIGYFAETYQRSRYSQWSVEPSVLDRIHQYYRRIVRSGK